MYKVEITAGGHTSVTRTSFPQRIVDGVLAHWKKRGFWVEEAMPGFDPDYKAFNNGRMVARLTVREEKKHG